MDRVGPWYASGMNSISSIAASGMRYADTSLSACASNTANLQSDGYKARVVSGRTLAGGGVEASVRIDSSPGVTSVNPTTGESTEGSNVDLEASIIGGKAATFMYAANAAVLSAAEAATGTLLDRLA